MSARSDDGDCYYLATGSAGEKRLALLDEVYGPDAARIMQSIGIPLGARVADLGCGTGNVLRWFATQVGEAGDVTGLDFSAEQLAIAQASAVAAGHRNVHFVEGSIYDTGMPHGTFDVVHCRFVLCHLTKPMDALREMAALARPGGLVIAFEVDLDGIFSAPPTPAYERLRALFHARTVVRGSDGRIGLKLPRMFQEVGLTAPDIAFSHPIYLRGEGKRLWEHTFLEASAFMIENGLCTQTELDQLAGELAAISADETIAVAQATMPVTWARKPV